MSEKNIRDAASTIEGGNRWLMAAAFFSALSLLHDHAIGTYLVVPHERTPLATDEEEA
jgi:hypothetical protein